MTGTSSGQCRQLGVPFREDIEVVLKRLELVWPV
jgi:hypothetical protein